MLPVAASISLTTFSSPPTASVAPSGLTATVRMGKLFSGA
jgi:hypothetical protein